MPIVNMVDDENYPTDFLYVAEVVETSPLSEDQNTAVKIPRGTCLMCAFWGQGAGKCKEHG